MKTLFKNTYDEIAYKWEFTPKQEKKENKQAIIKKVDSNGKTIINADLHNESYFELSELKKEYKELDFSIDCTQEQAKSKDFLIDYITKIDLSKSYARAIVKRIAGRQNDRSVNACMQIVNSGFTEYIFEDITSEVFITLFEMVKNNNCFIEYQENGYYINFGTIINKEGKEKSAFNKIYASVRKTLSQYTNNVGNALHKRVKDENGKSVIIPITIVNYDAIATQEDKEGNTLEYLLTKSNPLYTQNTVYDGAIKDIIERNDFQIFMKFLASKSTNKHFKTLKQVLYGLLKGLSSEDIVNSFEGLTINKVKKARQELKTRYIESKVQGIQIELNRDNSNYMHGVKTSMKYDTYTEYENTLPYIKLKPLKIKPRCRKKDYQHRIDIFGYLPNKQRKTATKAYKKVSDFPKTIEIEYQETGYNSKCSFLNAIINQEVKAEPACIENCKQELEDIRKNYKKNYEKHVLNLHYIKSDFTDDHKTVNTITMQEGQKEGKREKKYIIDYRRNKLVVWYYYFNDEGKVDTEIIREYPIVDKEG